MMRAKPFHLRNRVLRKRQPERLRPLHRSIFSATQWQQTPCLPIVLSDLRSRRLRVRAAPGAFPVTPDFSSAGCFQNAVSLRSLLRKTTRIYLRV
jgi:hypothetical protein